jgi:hypothetical protein
VYALAEFGELLIAGGLFTAAGDMSVGNIASWDGYAWAPLGSGTNGRVRTLTVFNDQLIAGGDFTGAGGSPVQNIAAWNGSSWSPLGGGMGAGIVYALTVYDGKLIAGAAGGIAAWDGSAWSSLGSSILNVGALTVYGDDLIAAGYFIIEGVTVLNVRAWNGSDWSFLGLARDQGEQVGALAVYDGVLVVGINASDVFYDYGAVYTWNGSVWSCIGACPWLGNVLALAEYDGRLIVGGWSDNETPFSTCLAAWDGASWSYVGTGTNGPVSALAAIDGRLVAGGSFTAAGNFQAYRIAAWDDAAWSSLPPTPRANHWYALGTGPVGGQALTVYNNQVVAGRYIWDGTVWSVLGSLPSTDVRAFTVDNGDLYASIPAGVFRWDGVAWHPLGSGVGGVEALAVYDGRLIAGGQFTTVGGSAANCVAAWDGVAWAPVGSGVEGPNYPTVEALVVYDNKLVAGGNFTMAGGAAANNIAAWDGAAWAPLGSGTDRVNALAVSDDGLFAAQRGVVSWWDGANWTGMGSFTEFPPHSKFNNPGVVSCLAAYEGTIVAGGYFQGASNNPCSRIAMWDWSSARWTPLWTGMNDEVLALTVFGRRLIAVGYFTTAGRNPALVACWNPYGEVPVFITSFDARATEHGVDLAWDIAADEEILGYKIYRALEEESGGEEIITKGPIAPTARSYRDDTVRGGERYEYTLSVVLGDGSEVQSQKVTVNTAAYALALEQNHPNPFNPSTTISFTLPERTKVTLAVYDVQGKRVRTLVDAMLEEGRQEWVWDGKDSRGRPAATGVYFYRLETADRKLTRKMLLLK